MAEAAQHPWKTDDWWTSGYNFDDAVRKPQRFPAKVELHDVTLRDGEQTPAVVFTKEEKLEIALKLDEAGVHRIEAGMPAVSAEDRAAVAEIARRATNSQIFSFCRARKEDVDAALDCDVQGVVLEIPALSERLKVIGLTVETAARAAVEVIEYAKSHGLFVVFFPYDTTRSDWGAVSTMIRAGESAHADRLAVVDTAGAASPEGFALLVDRAREATKTPLEVHCHNTLSLGVADTIAGLRAGAVAAHASVNGIGEGAGNAALEEVAVALKLLYGVDTGVDLKKLHEASRLVEAASKIPTPVNKPVFGSNIFRRESGIVVERYYKMPEVARQLELFNPAWFAGETEVVLGKKSGKYSILYMLRKKGITASDEQVKAMLDEVKARATAKKDILTDAEFDAIAAKVLGHR